MIVLNCSTALSQEMAVQQHLLWGLSEEDKTPPVSSGFGHISTFYLLWNMYFYLVSRLHAIL